MDKNKNNVKLLLVAIILIFALVGILFYSSMMHLACMVSLFLALVTGGIFTRYLNGQYLKNLEQQEDLRKQLTSDLAHELRTPLTTVGTHLEMMIDGVWEATPQRLQSCYDEIGRLSKLVADLEGLAKSEEKTMRLKKTRENLLEIVRLTAKSYHADITIEGRSSEIAVDRDRIGQVLHNLISNASKYSTRDKKIRIEVQDTPRSAKIIVEDKGIGIAEADLPFIFERFYRSEKSRNRSTGGAGLGLAIVKDIVTAHGGTVTAESRVGEGSKFTVTLPK